MTLRTIGRILAALLAAPFAAAFAAITTAMTAIAFGSHAPELPWPYAVLGAVLFCAFEVCSVGLWIAVVEQPPGGHR